MILNISRPTVLITLLGLSIILQLFAAVTALRLIKVTGRVLAWTLVSTALVLMTIRRAIPFYQLIIGGQISASFFINEILGLALSMMMAVGIALIAPVFFERKRVEEQLRATTVSRDALKEEVEARKKVEEILRKNERFMTDVFSGIQDGIIVLDNDMNIVRANAAMERLYSTGTSLLGQKCFTAYHGRQQPCEGCPVLRTLRTAERDTEVLAVKSPQGRVKHWLELFSFPLLDEETGSVEGIIEYTRDITEHKKSEDDLRQAYEDLKTIQEQLMQSEKMATIGLLAAGVAHEINNPSSFVTNNLDMLGQYAEDIKDLLKKYDQIDELLKKRQDAQLLSVWEEISKLKSQRGLNGIMEDLPNLVKECVDGMLRITRIVNDLKTFSHVDTGELEMANIHGLLETALGIAWMEIKYKAEVVKDFSDVSDIMCYPQLLSQVFLNLLVNAAQAIPKKGTITIRTFMDKDDVVVKIADTGAGMAQNVLKRIFEPFFTTKPVGKGTGLGLSMAHKIIEKHQGEISVDSRINKGTEFTIRLPMTQIS